METQSLAWGLPDVIPAAAPAAWGARAIITNHFLDLLADRMAFMPEDETRDKAALIKWLDKKAIPWMGKLVNRIGVTDDDTHALDDGRFHLRCNARRSYGYLYVAAWVDPTN